MVYKYRLDRNLSTKGRTALYSKNERTWSVDFIIDDFSSSNFVFFVLGDSSNFDDYEEEPREKTSICFFSIVFIFFLQFESPQRRNSAKNLKNFKLRSVDPQYHFFSSSSSLIVYSSFSISPFFLFL